MYRFTQYGFPKVLLKPGESRATKIDAEGAFRMQRLTLFGHTDAIRGHFWIKRSRLPRLDRDCVTAYSTLSRYKSKRRTVVECHESGRRFTRTYLPASVVYEHKNPLSGVTLDQIFVGHQHMFPNFTRDVIPATAFEFSAFGTGIPFPDGPSVSIVLTNRDDVDVTACAIAFGVETVADTKRSAR